MSRRTRLGRLELLIGAAVVLLGAVVYLEHRYTSATFDSARNWSAAFAETKVSVTESHLWLEERLSGDASVDVRRQVSDRIDAARAQCRALVAGGRTDLGQIPRLPPGEARSKTALACRELLSLRAAATSRLRSGAGGVGTAADESYDASYERVIGLTRAAERATSTHVADRHAAANRVNAATIAFLFLLLGGIVLLIRRNHSRLRRLAAGNESILEAAGEGIYGLDSHGMVTFANPAAMRMTGHEMGELDGRNLHEHVHHSRADGTHYPVSECPMLASLEDGAVHRSDDDVFWRKDGTSFPVEFTSTPIVEGGAVKGAVEVFRDITERKATEELLERQRRQLVDAQAIGGFGSWEWDIAANRTEWSAELYRIYGVEASDEPRTFEDFLACVYPDDREAVQRAVMTAYETGEAFAFEHRIVHPDGTVRVAQARGEVIMGDDGTPLRMLGSGQDITERREVERAKDEFASIVSHELRTPLTAIRGSLGLLEAGMVGPLPEKGQRMVEVAVENTDRLVRLINDILDIERIDSGQIDMHPQPCDAAELIERAIEGLGPIARDAQVTLVADAPPAPLFADPDRVLQTLTNLISNAIKFSPAGTDVRVSAERRDHEVLFQVRDKGRGIPADKLASIFERFQQVDASDAREKGGTGLGLAICRTIVEHHHGRIWVESELGTGSTFAFVLPAPAFQAAALPDGEAGRATILVCDDDAAVVEVIGAVLEHRGYRAVPAHSGEQALERAITERPDAILLDLLMPGMSGGETAAALKAHPETSDIPIVILSVLSQEEAASSCGLVAGWVEKPPDEPRLLEALARAVARDRGPFKVLVVEDDADLADVISVMFEAHGIETYRAATGRKAIELSHEVEPDLLVLDVGLPEADGFEVVDWLRSHERLNAVTIVVYTGQDLCEGDRERLRLGSTTHFLAKGRISPKDFERHVIGLLGRLTRGRAPQGGQVPAR